MEVNAKKRTPSAFQFKRTNRCRVCGIAATSRGATSCDRCTRVALALAEALFARGRT